MSSTNATGSKVREKRGSDRRPVLYRLDVTDREGTLFGYLVDISSGGMRVRCVSGKSVEDAAQLSVLLPRWMELGDELQFEGRFAWCRPHGEDRSEGGFVFSELREAQRSKLEDLLDRIAEAALEDSQL